jgi:hypothetical protein
VTATLSNNTGVLLVGKYIWGPVTASGGYGWLKLANPSDDYLNGFETIGGWNVPATNIVDGKVVGTAWTNYTNYKSRGSLSRLPVRDPDGERAARGVLWQEVVSEPGPRTCSRDFPGTIEAAEAAEMWIARQTSVLGLGASVRDFARGVPQFDDITCLALRR